MKIPYAWRNTFQDKKRTLAAVSGIAFSVLLMFMQLGFRDGLFDASVTVHRLFDADLVLISPRSASSVRMSAVVRPS